MEHAGKKKTQVIQLYNFLQFLYNSDFSSMVTF